VLQFDVTQVVKALLGDIVKETAGVVKAQLSTVRSRSRELRARASCIQ
jgi:hypothetical protein